MSPPCLVVGCGSIGRRHIRNLRALGIADIAAVDPVPGQLGAAVAESAVTACSSLERGLSRPPGLALVCAPPHLHVPIARRAVAAGWHLFIEKPLAHVPDGIDDLLEEAAREQRLVYVGYNWRFHPGLVRVRRLLEDGAIGRVQTLQAEFGQYLPDWRPGRDYRQTYTAAAALGGGIILDSSHELDYVRWLAGEVEAVYCAAGRLSGLEMDAEDTAKITLRLQGGCLASVHVDCTQRSYTRTCKITGDEGTLVWDHAGGVRRYDPGSRAWQEEHVPFDLNAMYVGEIAHVLACARGEATPLVDGETGKRVLMIALAARRSAELRREVTV